MSVSFHPWLYKQCTFYISPPVSAPPPTMVTLPAIPFSLLSLFPPIFPTSYLWKWQCYLQPLSSGFADRENGSGDHIRPGPGLWRMIGWACIQLHLWNLIYSHCWESPDKPVKASRGGKTECNTMGLEKEIMNWEDGRNRKTGNDLWWW